MGQRRILYYGYDRNTGFYAVFLALSLSYLILLILFRRMAEKYTSVTIYISVMLVGFSAGFILSSYSQKAISIAYADTYSILIVLLLATALHYTFQNTRMMQFVLYHKNMQNQREL